MVTNGDIQQFKFGCKLKQVNNNGGRKQFYDLVAGYNFTNKPFAASVVISAVNLSDNDELIQYQPTLNRFCASIKEMTKTDMGLRSHIRLGSLLDQLALLRSVNVYQNKKMDMYPTKQLMALLKTASSF